MSTKIRINKIIYEFSRKDLEEKYDFFTIETSEKYIKRGAFILDAPTLNDKIKSIVFESGRKVFVMMERGMDNKSLLKQLLKEIEEGKNLFLADCTADGISDYLILRLLLNNLSSYDSDFLRFNNLTGHLYCFHQDWLKRGKNKNEDIIWKVPCLEIGITDNFCLEMNVRTFTSERLKNRITFKNRKFEEYPQYVFAKGNTLRRKITDDTEPAYIIRQVDGDKTQIPFLDIQNIKRFEACKMGILTAVINTFNSKYDHIAHIELGCVDTMQQIDYSKKGAKEDTEKIGNHLLERGVHVVDFIGDEYSALFCKRICALIREKYGCDVKTGKRIKKESLNICVIHNAEYYTGSNDPHDKEYPGTAVQHVTLEDFSGHEEFAISTVIHEVLIKKDLSEGRITLFDWKKLGITEDISFGMEALIDDQNRYFFMNIHPDGTFAMKEQENNLFEMNEYSECVNIFEDARTKGEKVRGVIKKKDGNLNVIKDTGVFTVPEIEKIRKLLSEGDTKLRGKDKRDTLLSSCLDIKAYREDGKLFYFVGTIGEGMRWKIPIAANVRSIEGYNGAAIMFEKLLPTMNVTFVRNGQLTVLPFPFKYLREYIRNVILSNCNKMI